MHNCLPIIQFGLCVVNLNLVFTTAKPHFSFSDGVFSAMWPDLSLFIMCACHFILVVFYRFVKP